MIRRGSAWAWILGAALGLPSAGCFEDIQDPLVGTESSTGTGTSDGSTMAGTVDPDGTTAIEPDSGSHDGGMECPPTDVCVDLAPDGWEGPVAYVEGASLRELPSCAAPLGRVAVEAFDQLDVPPAECGACSCGDPTGTECSGMAVRFYDNSNCFGAPQSEFELGMVDECVEFPDAVGAYGAQADAVTPVPGTGACEASGGRATLPEPAWGTATRACAPPQAAIACGDGQVCVPVPVDPSFAPGLCVHREGDVACPGGPYVERFVRYGAVEDTRGCSDCGCGVPGGGTCTAEVLLSYSAICTDDYVHVTDPGGGTCTTLFGDEPGSGMLLVTGVSGGNCSPEGGEPQGQAVPAEPITFCCTA